MRAGKSSHWHYHFAIPVQVKHIGDISYQRAYCHHVQVAEGRILRSIEILIADIAPAHDGQLVIGSERFIVHAIVQAPHITGKAQATATPIAKGVKQSHLDIGMGIEPQQPGVLALGVQVIQQQAHPHPPLRRLQ